MITRSKQVCLHFMHESCGPQFVLLLDSCFLVEIRTRKDTHTRAPSPTYEHWLYNARVDERKILRRRCKTSLEKERRIESLHSLRNGHMENRRARKEKLLTDAQKLGVDFRHQLKADHLDEHLVDREDPNPFPLQAIEDTKIFSEPAKIEAHQEKHHKNMTGNVPTPFPIDTHHATQISFASQLGRGKCT